MERLKTLDLRGLSHEEKHGRIFPAIDDLKEGEAIEVTFDFNPLPLIYMLKERPDLKVSEEKNGPLDWILRIAKPGSAPEAAETEDEALTKDGLKSLLRELKGDKLSEETTARAKNLLGSVDATTLGLLEQELIREGISHDEIRKSLCDVHLEAMREALVAKRIDVSPPHPIHTFMEEHKIIVAGLGRLKEIVERLTSVNGYDEMGGNLEALKDVAQLMIEAELHHQREEDVLFPRLGKHGITEPPEIMKEEHVEFRKRKRELHKLVTAATAPFADFKKTVVVHGEYLTRKLESHIFKEDNILYQIALQVFSDDDWEEVKRACDQIGYCSFTPRERPAVVELDLRPLPPPERHKRIFEEWGALGSGEALRITNDHDPKPLYYQFEAEHKGRFSWNYEQKGPKDWVVMIKRL